MTPEITRRPRQFIAVWNDEGTTVKGALFEESLFIDGQFWKNEITSVAPMAFAEYGKAFANALQSERDALARKAEELELQVAKLQRGD